jgi:hypothetical protein
MGRPSDVHDGSSVRSVRYGGGGLVSEILTAEQLAERWQVTTDWIYAQCRANRQPKIPLPGKYVRFRLDVIEDFERGELDSGEKAA